METMELILGPNAWSSDDNQVVYIVSQRVV